MRELSPAGERWEGRSGPQGRWRAWLQIGAVGAFFVAWELFARTGWVRPLFISSPSRIWDAGVWLAQHGLWNDILVSTWEFALGMGLAIGIGLALGVLLGWYPSLSAAFDPFVSALYSTPRVAFLPLLILWLGIGLASKVAVVFLGAVFPILVSTMAGVRAVDNDLLTAARSFGASDRQVFETLALPSSVPFLISGLQLGVGRGLVGVVVGEFLASQAGIGHMMNVAAATFQTDKTFVGILILAASGTLISAGLRRLERRFDRWRPQR
jgi:ABC-type nitrate/sulfonate/bicarbonate transport system permease component